ncbi:MAG: hypothetical protein DCC71_20650, partial [Proteobacteria bacterium]
RRPLPVAAIAPGERARDDERRRAPEGEAERDRETPARAPAKAPAEPESHAPDAARDPDGDPEKGQRVDIRA